MDKPMVIAGLASLLIAALALGSYRREIVIIKSDRLPYTSVQSMQGFGPILSAVSLVAGFVLVVYGLLKNGTTPPPR